MAAPASLGEMRLAKLRRLRELEDQRAAMSAEAEALSQRQGLLIAEILRAVLNDPALGLSAEQRAAAPDTIRRHLALAAS